MKASTYRKKPVVVEALQFTGYDSGMDILEWASSSDIRVILDGPQSKTAIAVEVSTLEGVMRADLGDWIIKGIQNEFYPCKDDIFKATYERVES